MDLVIFLEFRFKGTPDGKVWTDSAYARPYWDRYLGSFSAVTIVARVESFPGTADTWKRVDGEGVRVHALPAYIGPLGYIRQAMALQKAVDRAIDANHAYIVRVPGNVGRIAVRSLERRGLPVNLEVVGDPYDAFSRGANDHALRPFLQWMFVRSLRRQCKRASNVLYVTQEALQRRYPHLEASSTGASDVELREECFVASNVEMMDEAFLNDFNRGAMRSEGPIRFGCVASMEQPYKGHRVLVSAFALLSGRGRVAELVLIGDGRYRHEFAKLSDDLGVGNRVHFLGALPAGKDVRLELDRLDVYVQPSLVEGMPRALIEAMGRGLPCIATSIGGIPELLPAQVLVRPGSARELADAMMRFIEEPEARVREGLRNLTKALQYRESILQPKREAFYRAVIRAAEASLGRAPSL